MSTSAPDAKKRKMDEESIEKQGKLFDLVIEAQKKVDEVDLIVISKEIVASLKLEIENITMKKPLFEERDKVISQIEEFWLQTLCTHPLICMSMTEKDFEPLKSLKFINFSCNQTDKEVSFILTLKFDENEYFTNSTLIKTITHKWDNPEVTHITQSGIQWKDGMREKCIVSQEVEVEVEEGEEKKITGKKRPREMIEISFFEFFEKEMTGDEDIFQAIKEDVYENPLEILFGDDDDDDEDNGEACKCVDCDVCNEEEGMKKEEKDVEMKDK